MALFNDAEKRRLAQLCTLIYLEGVADQNGKTIGEVVDNLLSKNGLEKSHDLNKVGTRDEYPCWMSKEEWSKVLKDIKKDPELCSYTIKEGVDKNDLCAMCCVKEDKNNDDKNNKDIKDNKNNEVIVVIRGGGGEQYVWRGRNDASPKPPTPKEKAPRIWRETEQGVGYFEEISAWHDDGVGGYRSITEKMAIALDYVKKLPYTDLTVAGHSSAGRDAQITAVLCDKVKRSFSYDGQGVSPNFIEELRNEIVNNCHKILSLSPKDSFVNCLLPTIAGTREYIDANPEDFANTNTEKESQGLLAKLMEPLQKPLQKMVQKLKDYPRNHCPHIAFNEQGDLRRLTKQGILPKFINQYTTYAVTTLKDPKRIYTLDGLMGNLEKGVTRESTRQRLMAAAIMVSLAPGFAWNQIKEKPGTDIYSVLKKIGGKKEDIANRESTQRPERREEVGTQQSQNLINISLDGGFTINEKKANEASRAEVLAALRTMYNNIEPQITHSQKVETQKLNSLYYEKLKTDQIFSSSPNFGYVEKNNMLSRNYTETLNQMTDSFLHAVNKLNENNPGQHFSILSAFAKDVSDSLCKYEEENKKITVNIDSNEKSNNPAKQVKKEDKIKDGR